MPFTPFYGFVCLCFGERSSLFDLPKELNSGVVKSVKNPPKKISEKFFGLRLNRNGVAVVTLNDRLRENLFGCDSQSPVVGGCTFHSEVRAAA